MRRAAWLSLAFVVTCAATAHAQRLGRVSVAGGVEWMGGIPFGTADATEITPTGAPTPIFRTASSLEGSAGVGARVSVRLTPIVEVEAVGSYLRPSITTHVTGDVEGTPDATVSDRLRQITVEGAVLLSAPGWHHAAVQPFFSAGAGYLRQLHEGDTLAATGKIFGIGGGARIPFSQGDGTLAAFGLRTDVRAVVRSKAAALYGGSHVSPSIGVSLYATF